MRHNDNAEDRYYYHGTQPDRIATIKKSGLHSDMNYFDRRWRQALQRGPELVRVHYRNLPKDTMFDAEKVHAYTREHIKPSFIEFHRNGTWVRLLSEKNKAIAAQAVKPASSLLERGLAFLRRQRA